MVEQLDSHSWSSYPGFVGKVDPARVENPADDVVGRFILGSIEFVKWVKKAHLSKRSDETEIPQLKELKRRFTPDAVAAALCEQFDCDAEWILRKGRKRNTARDVAIYLAGELTGASGVELGNTSVVFPEQVSLCGTIMWQKRPRTTEGSRVK